MDTDDTTTPDLAELGAALTDPTRQFTREEVAILIDAAFQWGYEHRVDEENATYPPPKVLAFGAWYSQALEREKADAETQALLRGAGL